MSTCGAFFSTRRLTSHAGRHAVLLFALNGIFKLLFAIRPKIDDTILQRGV